MEKLSSIEGELVRTVPENEQLSNYPTRLNEKLAELPAVVASTDARPTRQSREVFDTLSDQADAEFQRLREVLSKDIQEFVELLVELNVPHIVP